ncbi:type II secretion system F family protein [Chungangia koreensis]|uniref:Type II secretion system F family protein n=1 Tax=Chungangia koreensis TaxID=752657 RepID=A0ABV8X1V2_9LACT
MINFLVLITIGLLLGGVYLTMKEKKRTVRERIAFIRGDEPVEKVESSSVKGSLSERLVEPKIKAMKKNFNKTKNRKKSEKIELKLLRAGKPFGMSPFEFKIIQWVLMIGVPVFFLVLSLIGNLSTVRTFFLMIMGFSFAAYLPHAYVNLKIKSRAKLAIKELSDFVDLLAVSMEAGLGFDQALSKVVLKKQGVLSEEFQRCLEELRLGKTRREALSGVRERLDVDDIKMLVGNIIQAEQLGVGMVQILRIQAEEVRVRRKQRAEEQAMKAPVKMLFPLVLFIFPCIFIILLGPVMLQLMDTFK